MTKGCLDMAKTAKTLFGRLCYALVLPALGYAIAPTLQASGDCCTYSSDCGGTYICCSPSGGTAACSEDKKNYCKDTSGGWC
jgi:hypothetical protein